MIALAVLLSVHLGLPTNTISTPARDTLSPMLRDNVSQVAVLDPPLALGPAESDPALEATPLATAAPRAWVVVLAPDPGLAADTTRPRPKAIEYSSFYYTRLTIHKYASYATIPLFVAEAIVGQKLYNSNSSDGLRGAHVALAAGIGVLFGVNTVTGAWNFWESRKEPAGRTRRTIHSLLMLASDAGFLATALTAPHREHEGFDGTFTNEGGSASTHRALAITSGGVALAGYLMMLLWKD